MESVYILIPLSIFLVLLIVIVLWWSAQSGQFDDLDGPGYRIIMDDDTAQISDIDQKSKNKADK